MVALDHKLELENDLKCLFRIILFQDIIAGC